MSEDVSSTASRPSVSKASSSSAGAPTGHAFRRAQTIDEASTLRRRATLGNLASDTPFESLPRRSSNFSEYSFGEAQDILNPRAQNGQVSTPETSSLASLSLAFALLPALAGALFKDGSAVVTDVMLLGLAGIFLHWSVTQPWTWYRSAQEIRIQNEEFSEDVIEDDEDEDELASPPRAQTPSSPLEDVLEEGSEDDEKSPRKSDETSRHPQLTSQQKAALGELYAYEIAALFSCALLPLISAYLLHAIRSQLSRPSEGLVSNYNLTIFLMVSELRVFSHMFKLVQSRTLHLQKVVHGNPFLSQKHDTKQLEQVLNRLERLETRSAAEESLLQQSIGSESNKAKQEVVITREVRNAIQPELDALNRAVRRYEKKATVLQFQTESRFAALDARLGDAIALAAAAAKNSTSRRGTFTRMVESVIAMILYPFYTMIRLLLLPVRLILPFVTRKKRDPDSQRASRMNRQGKAQTQARYSGDRVPSRVARR
ncbi:hypothetical protein HJFPF1_02855 [Paramyrothecium foliicola]|nr:hypothetical protein HJFPF1_02855 [Paramyrothecium foliicola]